MNLATEEVIEQLDNNFFRVRFDRLTPGERVFLRTMADLGEGPYKAGDIADKCNVKISTLSTTRANLMKKGMIYRPSYGYIAFTVPLFDAKNYAELSLKENLRLKLGERSIKNGLSE